MRRELEELNSRIDSMSREEMILSLRRLMKECSEKDAILEINSAAATEMSIQFRQIKDENTALKKENKELLRQNRKLTDQLRMRPGSAGRAGRNDCLGTGKGAASPQAPQGRREKIPRETEGGS